MVLFSIREASHSCADGAGTHHCIDHAVGKFDHHDDATIEFERSHCRLFALPGVVAMVLSGRRSVGFLG